MLTLYCTYLQIMPEFLDLLMIFEKQSRPQHFHRSFFQHRTRLSDNGFKKSSRGLAVPDLGWSGRDLQLCYNLKCAERSSQGDWPWSIRDCVVDHSFDVEFVRITWVIFKGDSLIQDRIQSATTDPNTAEMSSFQTPGEAFASTLMTHLLLIEWASENWDQYCVFVEAKSYAITGGVLSNNMDLQPHIVKEPTTGITPKPERTGTGVNAISVASVIARARTRLFQSQIRTSNRGKRATSLPIHGLEADLEQPIPPVLNETVRAECYFRGQKEFAFGDLQELQYIYDKINEALFVLELDVNSFYELLQYYESVLSLTKFPQDIARDCKEGFQLFRSQIKLHANHLHNCKLRFRTLAENVSNSIKLVRAYPQRLFFC